MWVFADIDGRVAGRPRQPRTGFRRGCVRRGRFSAPWRQVLVHHLVGRREGVRPRGRGQLGGSSPVVGDKARVQLRADSELFESLPMLDGSKVLLIDMSGSSTFTDEHVISEQERIRREIDRYAR